MLDKLMENKLLLVLLVYLLVINLITFIVFGVDKYRAIHGRWRVPEATLLGLCAIGGSFGGIIAMYTLRHKTKKNKFRIGVPAIIVVQIAVVLGCVCRN